MQYEKTLYCKKCEREYDVPWQQDKHPRMQDARAQCPVCGGVHNVSVIIGAITSEFMAKVDAAVDVANMCYDKLWRDEDTEAIYVLVGENIRADQLESLTKGRYFAGVTVIKGVIALQFIQ